MAICILARLHGKRLLFKSPDHTFSIPQILEVFPEARFVTILREPYSQFASFAADVPAAVTEATGTPYVPNRHPDLSEPLKARIRDLYRPCVEAGLFDESELA